MAGLRDIARHAGVSASTVSRALQGNPRISEATRERVAAAAAALDYRPNDLAGRVMSEHRRKRGVEQLGAIALVLEEPLLRPHPAGHPFTRFREGVERAASARGFAIDALNLNDHATAQLDRILLNRGHRGILAGPSMKRTKALLRFDHRHYSVVMTGWGWQHPPFHRVATDHAAAMRLAIHHLRHTGARRIAAFVSSHTDRRCDHSLRANFLAHHPSDPGSAARLFFDDTTAGMDALRKATAGGDFDALLVSAGPMVTSLPPCPSGPISLLSLDDSLPADLPKGFTAFGHFDQSYEVIGAWALELLITEMLAGHRSLPDRQKILLVAPEWNPAVAG